jgi:AraC-like DNA-binding protein
VSVDRPLSEASVPAGYLLHLVAGVRMCGKDGDALLRAAAQSAEQLLEPGARLAWPRFTALCQRAVELSGEPGLGLLMGAQAPISRFGSVGFAAMAAADLRAAIELVIRFMPTISDARRYELRIEGRLAVLELIELVPFGAARELIVFAMSTSLWRLGEMIAGQPLRGDVEFAFARPGYFDRFAGGAPGACHFSATGHRLRFDAALLDLPLVTADAAAARSAREQCELELTRIEASRSLVGRVREALVLEGGTLPSPRQLARRFGMAERTLKRRLAEHGTSYSLLLDEQRRQRACELLRTDMNVDQIAERLGYSDAANFTRAFRRWTGQSPRAFRRLAS